MQDNKAEINVKDIEKDIIDFIDNNQNTSFYDIRKNFDLWGKDSGQELDTLLRKLAVENLIFFNFKNKTYNGKANEEIIIGTFKATRHEYAFVEKDELSIYIPKKYKLDANDGDEVEVRLFPPFEDQEPGKRTGKVLSILKTNN